MTTSEHELITRPSSDVPDSWRPAPSARAVHAVRPSVRDRLKERALGPALMNEDLAHERLGKPTALAVFSSDALSSTAYATEEILKTLLEAGIGVIAFSRVVPITVAMVIVLAILMFSYRQTIKAYPSAGGAYIVTKDNLGLLPAQVAGVALLTDYILTVAVSVSAGTAALYSAIPATYAWRVPLSLVFIAVIAWGNLRGVKESGKLFAAPTYCFILSMLVIIAVGIGKALTGNLHQVPLDTEQADLLTKTAPIGLFLILHAFASGGAAMTGVEAISNGVPAFRKPEWLNARKTLMWMGTLLGVMFLGLSWLASRMHPVPTADKTVISQIAKGVLGSGPQFFLVQLFTLLILVLAANTSFADFPRLASFHAEDAFMPRQLTKRGHRLAFSNGIIFLAIAAGFLVVLFQANVSHLIPLYAIGVFTSFTLSQAGMAVHHIKIKEPKWQLGLVINGAGAVATGVVTVIIAVTKFTHGAWAIMLLVPLLVMMLVRLNHQYESEHVALSEGIADAVVAPVPNRHVSLVLIGSLDNASARALRVARTLRTDRIEAIHVAIDEPKAERVYADWERLRPEGIDLRVVYAPNRKLENKTIELVAGYVSDGRTQVSVLIPRLHHRRVWHRLLHDRTSDRIAESLNRLPNVNVTFVPFHLGGDPIVNDLPPEVDIPDTPAELLRDVDGDGATDRPTPIGALEWRQQAIAHGTVTQLAIETVRGVASCVAVISDPTGELDLLFLGRGHVAGIALGAKLTAKGMATGHRGRLTIMNPTYTITETAHHQDASPNAAAGHH